VVIGDKSSYQQWKSFNFSYGGKSKPINVVKALVEASTLRVDYGFKSIAPVFDTYGANFCNYVQSPSLTGVDYLPCYALALNCVQQLQKPTDSSPATTYTVEPLRRLYMTTGVAGGQFMWTGGIQGQDAFGNAASTLQCVSTDLSGTNSSANMLNYVPMGKAGFLSWSSIKLNLYGATAKPVRWLISLCHATEDEACPFYSAPNTAVPTDQQQALESLIRPCVANPISNFNHKNKPKFVMLKSWTVDIEPTSTTESDTCAHIKTVNIFNRWNKITEFNDTTVATVGPSWTNAYGTGATHIPGDNVAGDGLAEKQLASVMMNYTENTNGNSVNARPQDKKVLFLLVRATDWSHNANGVATTANDSSKHGSFDVIMRSSWKKLGPSSMTLA